MLSEDVDRPAAITADDAARGWRERDQRPEMVCAAAWSEACRAWWHDPADDRLRRRIEEVLFVSSDELATWTALRLDAAGLVRAHEHVIAMRAGIERGIHKRTLVAGALRTGPVMSQHRSGRLVVFIPASEVPAQVARVAASFDELPQHPFMRAAWTSEVLGSIHPFIDGNGGTARFMSSLELARAWLPPLTVSTAQRRGSYIDAIVTHDLGALELVVFTAVQQELARLLVGEGGPRGAAVWDDVLGARAERWVTLADAAWRRSAGGDAERDEPGAGGVARLARAGYGFPMARTRRCVRWRSAAPLPVQLELAIAPVLGGGQRWCVAMLAAGAGDDGVLGARLGPDEGGSVFVAAAGEADAALDARFERWLTERIAHAVRRLAAWS